ncbi:periplasmic solute binding family protein [Chlamydia ibidis]|uniref:Periplasmic solute binding family protein n=2 Tax=Chlamydia ibidis TaxID=1405396 RepID=S7J5S8_9CHLA|nr:zinc ABC transporter substrate-binding protein [Chlamydia ibidis]EPP35457.1 periplasmic solute binding family protein [Chlamydia ibidis]EQM62875.1 periplasmic solute binding family protein [Chlamydia ibidis 10-1398/6]
MRSIFLFCSFFFFSALAYGEPSAKSGRVLVSIAPYKFLVEQISGDTCEVSVIVSKNFDPHTYEPSPSQLEKFLKADLWFRMGEPFEAICKKVLSCKQVDLTKNITMISLSGKGCSHRFTSYDTHTWLSPKNLQIQVKAIVNALVTQFPQHTHLYQRNGEKLLSTLDSLDKEISQITSNARQRNILVSHGAFAYFCRDYDFSQHTVERSHHLDPSPKDIVNMAQTIRNHHISSIILLRHSGKRSTNLLAERFGLQTVTIDPYEEHVIDNLKTIATTFAGL